MVKTIWEDILTIEVVKSDLYEKKAKFLVDTYKCFTESDKFVPNKWANRKNRFEAKPIERPRIGNKELSIEAITRKEFMSLMNKLTLNNKNTILKSLKNMIRLEYTDLYIDIIWDLMQRASDFRNIYFEVLKLFNEENLTKKWNDIWNTYYVHRSWMPTEQILNDNEDYDEFCDFIKWKKRAIAAMYVWILLYEKGIIDIIDILIREIVNDCMIEFNKVNYNPKKADSLLEQILILVNFTKTEKDDHIIELVKKWLPRAEELKPSSRFKLYDINDHLEKKMKSVYRVKRSGI